MYEAHFGLSPRPFAGDGEAVPLPSRDAALRRIRYGIEHARGPVLLFGPSGVGKTLMAHETARGIDAPAVPLAFPAMPTSELIAYLADELGADRGEPGLAASVRRVRSSLRAAACRGRRPLVIVDEAHLIDDPATFETLRLLLNFATDGEPDLALMIVGGPEVILRLPASLVDRLTARALLSPLAREETATYVLGRLASAGARSPLFDPTALDALHDAADGVPRRLNRLADLSLLIAYAEGMRRADVRTVEIAAREAAFEPIGV